MMNLYEVVSDFWHKNILRKAGDVVEMTNAEVKYLGHVVELIKDEVVEAVEAVEKPFKAVAAKVEDLKEDTKS